MKRLREIQEALPEGARLEKLSSGHLRVMLADGEPLRTASGIPIIISFSPSDRRSRLNELARIKQALR